MNAIQSFGAQGGMSAVSGQSGLPNQNAAAKNDLIKRLILQGAMSAKSGGACGSGGGCGGGAGIGGGCGGGNALDDTPPGIDPAEWARLSPQDKQKVLAGIAQSKAQGSAMNMCACGLGGCSCQKPAGL